jgi:hypothetical protein
MQKYREERVEQVPSETKAHTPSSRVLENLLARAPADYFTLGWLMSALHQRSFGIIMLFLALLATSPIGSTVPGLVLAAVTVQMIAGCREPVFPQFISGQRLPSSYLFRLGGRAVPLLRYLEKAVHPRWPTSFEAAKRFVGAVVLLLTVALLLTPVPLSNIAPATVIALISLAYIEEDGLLLCCAIVAGVVLIVVASAAVWGTIVSAILISRTW